MIDGWCISSEIVLSVIVTGLPWWWVNIGSGNGLVPSENKPLPEPMLTQIYGITRPQWVNPWSLPRLFLQFENNHFVSSFKCTKYFEMYFLVESVCLIPSAGYIYEYIQGQNNFITLHADDLLSIILLIFCGPYNIMQNGQWDLTIFCIISKDNA